MNRNKKIRNKNATCLWTGNFHTKILKLSSYPHEWNHANRHAILLRLQYYIYRKKIVSPCIAKSRAAMLRCGRARVDLAKIWV